MKKYLYLLVAIVCMGFTACSSDDDGDAESGLNGKWSVTASEAYNRAYEKVGSVWHFANGKVTIYDRDNHNYTGDYRTDPNSLTLYVTITKSYYPNGTLESEIKNNTTYYYSEDGTILLEIKNDTIYYYDSDGKLLFEMPNDHEMDLTLEPDEYKYSINGNVLQFTNEVGDTFILTRQ